MLAKRHQPPSFLSVVRATPHTLEALRRSLFASGRLCELSGSASSGKSTLALHLCLTAMREGEMAAWIDPTSTFWPVAALEQGDSLERLLVVRPPDGTQALRAADMLLSAAGAVSIIVVHLPPRFRPGDGQLFRLQRLAEKASTTLLLLDERPPELPSLGPSITLRVHAQRVHAANDDWALHIDVKQHKSGSTGPVPGRIRSGPNRLAKATTL